MTYEGSKTVASKVGNLIAKLTHRTKKIVYVFHVSVIAVVVAAGQTVSVVLGSLTAFNELNLRASSPLLFCPSLPHGSVYNTYTRCYAVHDGTTEQIQRFDETAVVIVIAAAAVVVVAMIPARSASGIVVGSSGDISDLPSSGFRGRNRNTTTIPQ